jgi:hypothetical protein
MRNSLFEEEHREDSPKSQRRIDTYEPVGDPAIKRRSDLKHFA